MAVAVGSTSPLLSPRMWILVAVLLDILLVLGGGAAVDAPWVGAIGALQGAGHVAVDTGYPAVFSDWLWFCGKLLAALHPGVQHGPFLRLLVVAPVLAAHVGLLLFIERQLRRQPGDERTQWLLAFAALNPAVLINGPLLGQFDLLYCLPLVLALYCLITGRRLLLVLPLLALAGLLRFQALCVVPVLLPLLWRRRSATLWAGALPALLLIELAQLPHWLAIGDGSMLRNVPVAAGDLYSYAGLSADNLWHLLGLDAAPDRLPLLPTAQLPELWPLSTPHFLGEAAFAVWSLWLIVSSWRHADSAHQWRNAVLCAIGFFLLLPGMNERDLLAAAVLSLAAAAQHAGFWRHAVMLSGLSTLNLLQVQGQYQDSAISYVLSALLLIYALSWLAWPLLCRVAPRLGGLPPRLWLWSAALICVLTLVMFPARPALPKSAPLAAASAAGNWIDVTRLGGRRETQGWGTLHIDRSVDGNPLTVGGRVWSGGFGTHAPGVIHLPLPGQAVRFTASVGLDQEAHGARVEFQVYADSHKLWDSGAVGDGEEARNIDVDVSGYKTLDLVVDPLGSQDFAHADWLEPRLHVAQ